MNEPIQNPQPLFFETEHLERTHGLKEFSREWKDILEQCDKDGINLATWGRSKSIPSQQWTVSHNPRLPLGCNSPASP